MSKEPVDSAVHWLKLDHDRLPRREVLEYAIQRPLVAASAVFTLEKTADLESLNVEGNFSVKIPFKGTHSFQGTSVSKAGEAASAFSIYKEWQDDKALRLWLEKDGRLTCLREGESVPRKDFDLSESEAPKATLLNALILLSVLSSAFAEGKSEIATQFVAADKLFALRIQVLEGTQDFVVFAKDVAEPLTSESWSKISWANKPVVEGTFDPAKKAISSLRVQVPVLGSLELPLIQCSRE